MRQLAQIWNRLRQRKEDVGLIWTRRYQSLQRRNNRASDQLVSNLKKFLISKCEKPIYLRILPIGNHKTKFINKSNLKINQQIQSFDPRKFLKQENNPKRFNFWIKRIKIAWIKAEMKIKRNKWIKAKMTLWKIIILIRNYRRKADHKIEKMVQLSHRQAVS